MRITLRTGGDHGAALARLRPGTRVLAEGPYGVFTAPVRHTDRVLLVAGGVGVAPIRALLEEFPRRVDVVLLYRSHSREDVLFGAELAGLLTGRSGRLHHLVGARALYPFDPGHLKKAVPDVRRRDIYVCGPVSLIGAVTAAARKLGVPPGRIHAEEFEFLPG